jgi:hypothetical protein
MNPSQELWWRQAESDHRLYVRLRGEKYETYHIPHYLQMATEKLSKAYLWRSGHDALAQDAAVHHARQLPE